MASAALAPFTRARAGTRRRREDLRQLVMELSRADFRRRYPDVRFGPVLVLIASYLEADNIGAYCRAVRDEVRGDYEVLFVYDMDDMLTNPSASSQKDVYLQPGDIVFVKPRYVTEFARWVRQALAPLDVITGSASRAAYAAVLAGY